MPPSRPCAAPATVWRPTVAKQRRRSLRARITLAATGIVGIALILGAVTFAGVLRVELIAQITTAVEADAEQYSTQVEASGVATRPGDIEDGFVQLSSGRQVLSASEDVAGLPQIVPPSDDDVWTLKIPDQDSAYLAATEVTNGIVIIAGRSLEPVDDTLAAVIPLLAVAVPLLGALVALTTWIVTGRALTPVERMRREVDEIKGTSLDRRVGHAHDDDEIGRLAATMNSMLDRLEHAQTSQRQFISDASHELKSPLASLRQYAEVATRHPDRISAAELSEAILDEGARLERLVNGMLVLAKADESSLAGSARTVDLDDLVLGEARRLRTHAHLTVEAGGVGPARVLGDEGLLDQIVRNLVDNAARHARSRVALSLTDDVLFAVDDDGAGVPDADRDQVFERFVRLDEGRAQDSGGSGLGLAIVRELVRAHGGSVTVTNSALGGARFEVRLPPAPED